jgi:methyl-accepting chemotaxis protein
VAARTIYPILKKNNADLGFAIAIQPAPVTVMSIEPMFGFTPQGLPPDWAEGRHHEFTVKLHAETVCLKCHYQAKVGEVLGQVTVRNYWSGHLARWLEEAQITTVIGMGDILLRTIVLFLLLKLRMEPLLALRAVVAQLAKAGADLSHRAPVKSDDEFGELAHDLNLFLERIDHILEDLGSVLAKVIAVNHRFVQVQGQTSERYARVIGDVTALTRTTFRNQKNDPLLSEEWLHSVQALLAALQHAFQNHPELAELESRTNEVLLPLNQLSQRARRLFSNYEALGDRAITLSSNLHEFSHFLDEMAILEEKMQGIAELGQAMLERLRHTPMPG